jgi:hypothetical protein
MQWIKLEMMDASYLVITKLGTRHQRGDGREAEQIKTDLSA